MLTKVFLWVSLTANVLFALILLTTWAESPQGPVKNVSTNALEQHPYLSKRIFAENQNDILINFIPLRAALREYVEQQPDQIGVYFEYLPSGTSIGVNDSLETEIASLIKIPTVMSIYKLLEAGQLTKDKQLTIREENLDDRFGKLWQRGAGATLTVEEIIKLALLNSDNTAYQMLLDLISPQQLAHVFDSLDVVIHRQEGEQFITISPKSYASIFRSLYLASYLNQQSSNEILALLTQTPFNEKIAGGIPSNIKVAHKIGVFTTNDDPQDTYSDCGIVYVPQRPYILCIMAKTSEAQAQTHMQHLSKMIYGYIVATGRNN